MKTKPHNRGLRWPGCLLVFQRKTLLGLGMSSLQMERKELKTLFTGEILTQLWESRHPMPLIPTKFTRWCYPYELNGTNHLIISQSHFTIMWLAPNHNILDIGVTHFTLTLFLFLAPSKLPNCPWALTICFTMCLPDPQYLYKIPSVSIQFSS